MYNPNQLPEQKEADWKNILTIVFLAVAPVVGVILMWLIAGWRKKIKVIITLVLGLFVIIPVSALLLSSIVITSLASAKERARDALRAADLSTLQTSLALYHDENGVYPSGLEAVLVFLNKSQLPKDPKTSLPYEYKLGVSGQDFELCANFESKTKNKENCLNSNGQWQVKAVAPIDAATFAPCCPWLTNFDTYTNSEYGFEFQYPKDFSEDSSCKAKKLEQGVIGVGQRILITIQDSLELGLEQNVDEDLAKNKDIRVEHMGDTIVGRQEAISVNYRLGGINRYGQNVYFLKDTDFYTISFTSGGECQAAYDKNIAEQYAFSQILTTFKFLK